MSETTDQQEAEAVFAALRGVPEIGDTFEYAFTYRNGYRDKPERWRVSCFFKRFERAPVDPDLPEHVRELLEGMRGKYPPPGHGPDNVPLVICRREEAEYVEGVGLCGIIVRVSDVHVTGRVSWPEESLAHERETAKMLIGEVVR